MKERSRFEKVGDILTAVLAENGYLSVARETAMIERWPSIAGEQIAAVTSCERAEDGVLYIRVSSAPWRQELAYQKQTMLDAIRKECATIKDLVFY